MHKVAKLVLNLIRLEVMLGLALLTWVFYLEFGDSWA